MAKKEESDQTLTTANAMAVNEFPQSDPAVESPVERKAKSGIFGIVALASSLVLILVTLFNTFGANGQFHLDSNTNITISLKLSSQQFLVVTSKNVCDGIGDYQGIRTSSAIIQSSSINKVVEIGTGQLNDKGACEYLITVPTPANFNGGKVNFSFKFPFGESEVFRINVGKSAPYKTAVIEIPFD